MNMNFIALSSRAKLLDRPQCWAWRSRRSRQDTPGRCRNRSRDGYARKSADSAGDVSGRLDAVSITELCGEACALERSDAPIRIGAQLGREGVQGLERALDRGPVGGGLRSQEANPRQRDVEGTKPPASSPIDELTRLREDRKSTRLNSSHTVISYAVFCLKKKNTTTDRYNN